MPVTLFFLSGFFLHNQSVYMFCAFRHWMDRRVQTVLGSLHHSAMWCRWTGHPGWHDLLHQRLETGSTGHSCSVCCDRFLHMVCGKNVCILAFSGSMRNSTFSAQGPTSNLHFFLIITTLEREGNVLHALWFIFKPTENNWFTRLSLCMHKDTVDSWCSCSLGTTATHT